MRKLAKPKESDTWDGPLPSKEQQKKTSHYVTEHLTEYYETSDVLIKEYPEEARQAQAIRRYRQLEADYAAKLIDEIQYNIELEKILPLISISDLHEK